MSLLRFRESRVPKVKGDPDGANLMTGQNRIAVKKEWSFAEAGRSDWELPPAIKGGWKVNSDEELNHLRFEDQGLGL